MTPIGPHTSYQLLRLHIDQINFWKATNIEILQLLEIVTGAELAVKPVWSFALKPMLVPYDIMISQGHLPRACNVFDVSRTCCDLHYFNVRTQSSNACTKGCLTLTSQVTELPLISPKLTSVEPGLPPGLILIDFVSYRQNKTKGDTKAYVCKV